MKGVLLIIFTFAALALLFGEYERRREYPITPKKTLLIAALAGLVFAFWILHHGHHHV